MVDMPPDADRVYCVSRQQDDLSYQYQHVWNKSEIPPNTLAEMVDHAYLTCAERRNVVHVALLGPSTAGKTVWQMAVGAQTLLPSCGTMMHPNLASGFMTTAAIGQNDRMHRCLRLGLGELPGRTAKNADAQKMSYPLCFAPVRDGAWSVPPRKLNWLNRILSPGQSPRENLAVVLKDVAGEAISLVNMDDLLDAEEKQHLKASAWHCYIIQASNVRSDLQSKMREFLRQFGAWVEKGLVPRPRGAIIALSRVDELMYGVPTSLTRAVMTPPYHFEPETEIAPAIYWLGMQNVENEVKAYLKASGCSESLDRMNSLYPVVHCTAFSALGMMPTYNRTAVAAQPAGNPALGDFSSGNSRSSTESAQADGYCVTNPAMVRVMDPILWILKEENVITGGS
jgi:hypothetical protein